MLKRFTEICTISTGPTTRLHTLRSKKCEEEEIEDSEKAVDAEEEEKEAEKLEITQQPAEEE